jgi:hypothetical protein
MRKNILSMVLLASAMAAAAQSFAQPGDPTALPDWDRLTPTQQAALVAPLRQRWNDNPDGRARMLERAERWQSMTPEQRKRARHGVERWKKMSPEKREEMRALHGAMRAMPEAERDALRERWKKMAPEQRRAWVEAHPAPDVPPRER